jgi:hypothetical protein
MKGVIDRIFQNETAAKKKYWVLSIGGERYSVWDEKYIKGLKEGNEIDFDWAPSGDYKKITDISKISMDPTDLPHSSRETQILRMSCLKSASSLLSGTDLTPEEKGTSTLNLAKKFEKYVTVDEESHEREPGEEG